MWINLPGWTPLGTNFHFSLIIIIINYSQRHLSLIVLVKVGLRQLLKNPVTPHCDISVVKYISFFNLTLVGKNANVLRTGTGTDRLFIKIHSIDPFPPNDHVGSQCLILLITASTIEWQIMQSLQLGKIKVKCKWVKMRKHHRSAKVKKTSDPKVTLVSQQ